MMIVFELAMVLIFAFTLIQILGTFGNANLQVALLNTQVLKTKINEACITGSATMDGFQFPQSLPPKVINSVFFNALGKLSINAAGDPHYVLYYEAFPYAEGVGWEVHQNLDNRMFAPYKHPDDTGTGWSIGRAVFEEALEDHIIAVDRLYLERLGTAVPGTPEDDVRQNHPQLLSYPRSVVITNIELTDLLGAVPAYSMSKPAEQEEGEAPPIIEEQIRTATESFGEWERDDTFFAFANYRGLNKLQQSSIKYRPCGDNTLCLKTREGVYTFPLGEECKNVDYIGIKYDSTESKWVRWGVPLGIVATGGIALYAMGAGSMAITVGKGLLNTIKTLIGYPVLAIPAGYAGARIYSYVASWYLSYKKSDLYVASPCNIDGTLTVERVSCDRVCGKMVTYPIYKVNKDTVENIGEHATCLDNIGGELDEWNRLGSLGNGQGSQCLLITLDEKPSNYCWTPNPYPAGVANFDIRLVASMGALPIRDNTFYISDTDNQAVVVNKMAGGEFSTKEFFKHLFESAVDIDWVWPSGFLTPAGQEWHGGIS